MPIHGARPGVVYMQAAKRTAALEAAIDQEKQRADELLGGKDAAARELAELQQQCSKSTGEICSCRDEVSA
jgi:hypothetical protein